MDVAAPVRPAPRELAAELDALAGFGPAALRRRYRELFGEVPRTGNTAWLRKRIAWRIQAEALGGRSARASQRAAELACEADVRSLPPRKPSDDTPPDPNRDPRLPRPGTVLRKRYRRQLIEVLVLPEGFSWQGRVYSSLSALSCAVSGGHCNGFAFFGLTRRRRRP